MRLDKIKYYGIALYKHHEGLCPAGASFADWFAEFQRQIKLLIADISDQYSVAFYHISTKDSLYINVPGNASFSSDFPLKTGLMHLLLLHVWRSNSEKTYLSINNISNPSQVTAGHGWEGGGHFQF